MKSIVCVGMMLLCLVVCKGTDCAPNTALDGKWKQVDVISGQQLLGFEVEFKNSQGLITSVNSNPFGFRISDVVWKDTRAETNSIYDIQVLTRSTNGTSSYGSWKIVILPGGKSLAFTRPGNTTDVYERWERM